MHNKKDYIFTTNSLNIIHPSFMPYDDEKGDIILPDGSSLKDYIQEQNKPQPPGETDEETSIADKAIVGVSKSK